MLKSERFHECHGAYLVLQSRLEGFRVDEMSSLLADWLPGLTCAEEVGAVSDQSESWY